MAPKIGCKPKIGKHDSYKMSGWGIVPLDGGVLLVLNLDRCLRSTKEVTGPMIFLLLFYHLQTSNEHV